jgi:hypothetical protein
MAGKDKLAEAPGLTDRQKAWARASDEEHDRGNEFAAGFFALLALPSEQERAESREAKRG